MQGAEGEGKVSTFHSETAYGGGHPQGPLTVG